jgi:hypothetical protein
MFLQNYGNNLEDNKASHLSRSLALTDRNTGGIVASLIPELAGPSLTRGLEYQVQSHIIKMLGNKIIK